MDHSREIRQLWFISNSYFEEAERLKSRTQEHLDIRMGDIMDFYKDGIPTEDYQKELSLLVAHLNSAAVRLVTINERFRKDLGGEILKDYITDLLSNEKKLRDEKCWDNKHLAEKLRRNIQKYLPQMLRDSVAHIEREENPKKGPIWQARQTVIESLKIIEVFTWMQSAMSLFRTRLKNIL